MAYTFTNIITSLPFDYYIKVEFIRDTGTGTLTKTNGGYIGDVGKITTGIDSRLGEYKLPSLTMTVRNVENFYSGTLFTVDATGKPSWNSIDLRIWISYDAGTTYENLFFGRILPMTLRETHTASEETFTRLYEFTAVSSLSFLSSVAVDPVTKPWTPVQETTQNVPGFTLRDDGSFFYDGTTKRKWIYFTDIMVQCFSYIPFNDTVTTVLDTSDLEHAFYNINNTTDYNISDLAFAFHDPATCYVLLKGADSDDPALPTNGWANYMEIVKMLCESLNIIPLPRLWDNAGTLTLTVELRHRYKDSCVGISGSLPTERSRSKEIGNHISSIKVTTTGVNGTSETVGSGGGQQVNIQAGIMSNYNITEYIVTNYGTLTATVDPYYLDIANIDGVKENYPSLRQMFVGNNAELLMVHKVKILASQSYQPPIVNTFTGLQLALWLAVTLNTPYWDTIGKPLYKIAVRSLKSNGVSGNVWDFNIIRKIVIDTHDCMILSIDRQAGKNVSEITAAVL